MDIMKPMLGRAVQLRMKIYTVDLGLTSPDLEAPAEMKNIVNDIVNYLQERFSAFIGKTDPQSAESEER